MSVKEEKNERKQTSRRWNQHRHKFDSVSLGQTKWFHLRHTSRRGSVTVAVPANSFREFSAIFVLLFFFHHFPSIFFRFFSLQFLHEKKTPHLGRRWRKREPTRSLSVNTLWSPTGGSLFYYFFGDCRVELEHAHGTTTATTATTRATTSTVDETLRDSAVSPSDRPRFDRATARWLCPRSGPPKRKKNTKKTPHTTTRKNEPSPSCRRAIVPAWTFFGLGWVDLVRVEARLG